MRHWMKPFIVGLVVAVALVAVAWLAPALLPTTVMEGMMQPSYRMEELVARFVPEVTAAMQRALASAAGAVLAGYVALSLVHLFARPNGPGEAGAGWRRAVWAVLLIGVLIAATIGAYVHLGVWLTIADDLAAQKWAAALGVGAAIFYWVLTTFGSERMMRPAVPLATRIYPA